MVNSRQLGRRSTGEVLEDVRDYEVEAERFNDTQQSAGLGI
jgi:hypothetical protein